MAHNCAQSCRGVFLLFGFPRVPAGARDIIAARFGRRYAGKLNEFCPNDGATMMIYANVWLQRAKPGQSPGGACLIEGSTVRGARYNDLKRSAGIAKTGAKPNGLARVRDNLEIVCQG